MSPTKQNISSELKPDDTFKTYLNFYTQRKGLSQNRLALSIRMNQSRLNKIANNDNTKATVDDLIGICLVLQLTLEEATDLLSRYERTFSPASKRHAAFKKLLVLYGNKKIDYSDKIALQFILDEADQYLIDLGMPPLPDVFAAPARK